MCIVDEATQVHLPMILGSLDMSNSFVLVGDHYQMSPLVLSKSCKLLSQSLFQILMHVNKKSMISLDEQFRMNPAICELSSRLFYENRLQPSDLLLHELSEKLQLPSLENVKISNNNKWLTRAISPNSHPVVFIDNRVISVHNIPYPLPVNPCINLEEVSATLDLVNALCSSGIEEKDIGVLAVYSDQVNLISFLMKQRYPGVEVHTIDRFQGRDKLCIILSFVTKTTTGPGSIINDPKRLNVALTRSRKKTFVLGDYNVLKQIENFKNIFLILSEHDALILD
ncbi:DNA replication ATP-dependent helicase/nuclease DNA2 [Thelohanellus kitauei]|uniref:DNA replication ATP-dependent helicase/nuclease n=1 Tax=Thelohanellus kitauei TaxID=669202 RepID=A0A0C2N534_THEKT|nr:DNA replication ATP-dependent helicase/nuclease DNA2 [Thelohanellus kitauei]